MKIKQLMTFATMASLAMLMAGCSDNPRKNDTSGETVIHSSRAFTKTDVRLGSGTMASAGQQVSVHYTGWIYDPSSAQRRGAKFDSSRGRGQPFTFQLGAGKVIKGWDQGVVGMKVGGQRTLIIPSGMAYGARGAGKDIPPHSTLIFDIELLDVR